MTHSVYDKVHSSYCNRHDHCGKKSREAMSKISDSEVTFVYNCVGSSSGKKTIPTARERERERESKYKALWQHCQN